MKGTRMTEQTAMQETTEATKARLSHALQQFHEAFQNDPDLVREGAKQHGVEVTEGTILEAPIKHAYSARIPTGSKEEIEAIEKTTKVVLACMDYRQVYEVYEGFDKPAVFIADAGGAAQPNEDRFHLTVELLSAIHAINPRATLLLTGHDEVCGGANFFTKGDMKRIRNEEGGEKEKEVMTGFLQKLATALIDKGVAKDKISLGLALVDEATHTCSGFKPLTI